MILRLIGWILKWPRSTEDEAIPISRVNDALRTACSINEWYTVLTLLNIGARPSSNQGAALMSAVLANDLQIVNTLLLASHAFDSESTVHLLNRAIDIANRPSAIRPTDPNIITSLQDQINFVRNSVSQTKPNLADRKKTTPTRYALMPDENCGGGTLSYCQRTESDQWPKYVDDKGCKRCCICGCRGPMIDTALMDVLKGAQPAITSASD